MWWVAFINFPLLSLALSSPTEMLSTMHSLRSGKALANELRFLFVEVHRHLKRDISQEGSAAEVLGVCSVGVKL